MHVTLIGVEKLKQEILQFLKNNMGHFISGQVISEKLGVTRAAVWKYIKILKEEGYDVESSSRKGYRLLVSVDKLTGEEIYSLLNTEYIGRNIIHFDTIDSTNVKAKQLAQAGAENGTIVISEGQTAGRGRLGRQWTSPKSKGIWLSVILKPDLEPINVANITLLGAAAVFKALSEFGIRAQIKWPNDIILNGKKLCGILTEMSCELNMINYIVMGIGINVNIQKKDFPEELLDTATSVLVEKGEILDRKKLTAALLNNFELLYNKFIKYGDIQSSIKLCKENSSVLGKKIKIIDKGNIRTAKAIDIKDNGVLIVEYDDGTMDEILSGEISVRGI